MGDTQWVACHGMKHRLHPLAQGIRLLTITWCIFDDKFKF